MNTKSPFRLIRVISGKSQVQVGNEAGINPSRISLIENLLATPRQDEMERLAKALGVQPEDIWKS